MSKNNANEIKRKNKIYFVTKSQNPKGQHMKHVQSSFEFPDKYLNIDPLIVVGRKIVGPRLDRNKQTIPHSIVGPVELFEDLKGKNELRGGTRRISKSVAFSLKKTENDKKTYDIIDDERISKVFNELKNLKRRSESKLNEFLKEFPEDLQHSLKAQESKLVQQSFFEESVNKLQQDLISKTKKNEMDLLINQAESFNTKKVLYQLNENKKNTEELRNGKDSWIISLRRPDGFVGTRKSYVNLGSSFNQFWKIVKETVPVVEEFSIKPGRPYRKFRSMGSEDLGRVLISVGDLMIKGRDLLEVEYDNAKSMIGKKVIYRKEYIEGKLNSLGNVSNAFNNPLMDNDKQLGMSQIIAKDYRSRSFIKSDA